MTLNEHDTQELTAPRFERRAGAGTKTRPERSPWRSWRSRSGAFKSRPPRVEETTAFPEEPSDAFGTDRDTRFRRVLAAVDVAAATLSIFLALVVFAGESLNLVPALVSIPLVIVCSPTPLSNELAQPRPCRAMSAPSGAVSTRLGSPAPWALPNV